MFILGVVIKDPTLYFVFFVPIQVVSRTGFLDTLEDVLSFTPKVKLFMCAHYLTFARLLPLSSDL